MDAGFTLNTLLEEWSLSKAIVKLSGLPPATFPPEASRDELITNRWVVVGGKGCDTGTQKVPQKKLTLS